MGSRRPSRVGMKMSCKTIFSFEFQSTSWWVLSPVLEVSLITQVFQQQKLTQLLVLLTMHRYSKLLILLFLGLLEGLPAISPQYTHCYTAELQKPARSGRLWSLQTGPELQCQRMSPPWPGQVIGPSMVLVFALLPLLHQSCDSYCPSDTLGQVANELGQDASQTSMRSVFHDAIITPSGCLPSVLQRRVGSSVKGSGLMTGIS